MFINTERFRAEFDALAEFGATPAGGVNRPCWSEAHLQAQQWWLARAIAAGLHSHTDAAGNVSATLRSANPQARTLLLGSHTDSVPNGGRFDGALGVLAALEVARTLAEARADLPVHVEVIDFADEEGTLVGLLGSRALTGQLTAAMLRQPRGGTAALNAGLARAGLTLPGLLTARRDPATLAGYLELHIEQGPRLARAAVSVGVVSAIVGIVSYHLTFVGQANHAGTTPMDTRRDALAGASTFILTAREMLLRDHPECTVNFGQVQVSPGAFNIIPGEVTLAMEFRAPEAAQLHILERSLLGLAELIGRQFRLQVRAELAGRVAPAPMSAHAQTAIAEAADSLALTHQPLVSGAGHDAQALASITPAGMIFVPSRDGLSHAPEEFTDWEACVNGANVLLRAALKLAESEA